MNYQRLKTEDYVYTADLLRSYSEHADDHLILAVVWSNLDILLAALDQAAGEQVRGEI